MLVTSSWGVLTNTHSFTYEGHRITLIHLQVASDAIVTSENVEYAHVSVVSSKPALLVTNSEILEEFQTTDVVFLLCFKPQLLSILTNVPPDFFRFINQI